MLHIKLRIVNMCAYLFVFSLSLFKKKITFRGGNGRLNVAIFFILKKKQHIATIFYFLDQANFWKASSTGVLAMWFV